MSFNSSDDDSQQRFALGFLFALIALVVSTVVGTVVYKRGISHAPKAEAAVSAPSATNVPVVVVEETARVIVENGVVKFYFVSGKAEVAAGANEALSNVVKGVAEGKRAVISGFHDATGSAEINAELAKQRAQAVQAALVALGVTEDKVELKKPEQSQADGSNAEARRVEVILAD
ncbi:UNVERIFIED_CONTAM: OmpA family protein [Comamonas sp. A-3]|uniref:OmpA family protein n=1 Tax=Comamonas thiooxydans TaxID=363952 RepID=A0AA42TUG6_9BURK|nr:MULTISPECIES: OmpA family protein [Comamonas]EFI59076.1 OmpA/MotB [Comamonas thiooxydans]MDH1254284.1 OmpA family protein [Comamonas thiooxydans]MDH1336631.1 OmpA family protein [Comamonas thiooxydans]MDH1473565.1 OmpA family protein [Comamonas thiooxydans]MDH1742679.1 OmpA family protein [Comamonas thiooxydans]